MMLESNLTLEQIAAAWLELWFALPRCGIEMTEVRAQRQAHNSRRPVGKALAMLVGTLRDDGLGAFTFTETRGKDDDGRGYLLHFFIGSEGEDKPQLAAEIDIRGEWMRGTIIGINQGQPTWTGPNAVRLIDPWQLVYHNLTSFHTDVQRHLLEQEERERAAMGEEK